MQSATEVNRYLPLEQVQMRKEKGRKWAKLSNKDDLNLEFKRRRSLKSK